MKFTQKISMVLVSALFPLSTCSAVMLSPSTVLYDNGRGLTGNGVNISFNPNPGSVYQSRVADSFSLSGDSRVSSIRFYAIHFGVSFDPLATLEVPFEWFIDPRIEGSSGPEELGSIGFGTDFNPVVVDTGFDTFFEGRAFQIDIDIPNLYLNGGEYWLSIQDRRDLIGLRVTRDTAWSFSETQSDRTHGFNPSRGVWQSGNGDLAFTINGTSVPEPSSSLLSLISFLFLGMRRKR